MEKIKKLFGNVSEFFKSVSVRFPVTMVLIVLFSVTASIFIDQDGSLGEFMENKTIPFLMFWGFGTFFAESTFVHKKALKWCGVVLTGLCAAALVYFSVNASDPVKEITEHWIQAYSIIMITLGVYFNYRHSGLRFNEYCLHVVYSLSRLAIICAVTGIGIAMVMGVFVTLLLNGSHYMLILRAEFLILGCLFGCGLLEAQIRTDREPARFFIAIVKYLLMIMVLAAFVIVYGYILKIIITRVMPSNEVFRILAGLFLIGLPIWTLIGTFEEDHFLVRIGVKLPFIFIPFLFLQGYSIQQRIAAYGMTPARYLCLVLMFFEIVYIIVYALRKRETGGMLLLIAGLAAVCLVFPYVNMFEVSNRSQKSIFDRLIKADFASLSLEEQSDLAGAYYYLDGNEAGKAILTGVDAQKIDAIKESGMIGYRDYDVNMYIIYDFPVQNADISGFDKMTLIQTSFKEEPEQCDPEKISFYDAEENLILTADMTDFVKSCFASYAADPFGKPDFDGIVKVDENRKMQVLSCYMSADREQTVSNLDIRAVLFEKSNE